jgi:NAD(P)H-nitrite reductase large subunit
MPKNIPEKGASLQRDGETYAIIPYLPGGIIDPTGLQKILDVAKKYQLKSFKFTSYERIALIGIKSEDIDKIWEELDMKPGGLLGKRVRSAKFCLGKGYCKKGRQETYKIGMKIDESYMGLEMPNKIKIGISGCPNSCGESAVKDIGLIGTERGWNLLVGGSSGSLPMIGQVFAKNLSDAQALDLMGKILSYYIEKNSKHRLGRFIKQMGFERFRSEILS